MINSISSISTSTNFASLVSAIDIPTESDIQQAVNTANAVAKKEKKEKQEKEEAGELRLDDASTSSAKKTDTNKTKPVTASAKTTSSSTEKTNSTKVEDKQDIIDKLDAAINYDTAGDATTQNLSYRELSNYYGNQMSSAILTAGANYYTTGKGGGLRFKIDTSAAAKYTSMSFSELRQYYMQKYGITS